MRLVGLLPARFHGITREFAKFGTIGVINVVVNFAVYNLLLHTVGSNAEVKAKAAATLVATTSAYFMNRHWTYRDRPKSTMRREYTLFFATNLVGLVIEAGTVWLTKYMLHQTTSIALNTAAAVGIGLGTIFRFWAYRTHVFRLAPAEELAEEVAAAHSGLAAAHNPLAAGTAEAPAPVHEIAPVSPAPRVVVTAVDDGTVVMRVLEPEPLDDIELEGMVVLADQPATTS